MLKEEKGREPTEQEINNVMDDTEHGPTQ